MGIRTYGLSGSGMDVDQMVKDLMKAQRTRYDTLVQKKTALEWKKTDYNTMYKSISEFRDTTFNYKLQNTLLPKTVSATNDTVVSAVANADAVNFNHSLVVSGLASGVSLTSSGTISGSDKSTLATQFGIATGQEMNLTLSDGTTTKSIKINSDQSIYEMVSNINNAGLKIKANYDATLDRFFLYSTATGSETKIDFNATDTTEFGLTTDQETKDFFTDKLKIPTTEPTPGDYSGKNASFTLDGVPLTQSGNTFTISGVTYTLKAQGASNVTVGPDNDKAISAVKSFVESYNTMLAKLNTEVSETKYKDFLPLTDEQKSAMEEADIKAWEEKAKSGTLRRDSILQSTIMKMRSNISSPIEGLTGKYNSMAAIGITSGTYSENGKLYVDETKLKKALEEDPDIINKIFGSDGDTSAKDGVAVRLYDTLKGSMDQITEVAGGAASTTTTDTTSELGKRINDYTKQMTDLNSRLTTIQERYYKQFNAMETALSSLSKQSAWLTQQLGGSSSS